MEDARVRQLVELLERATQQIKAERGLHCVALQCSVNGDKCMLALGGMGTDIRSRQVLPMNTELVRNGA